MRSHALTILLLPDFVGKLFRLDGISTSHHFMDEAAMEALAMSG
jgi:hypothetical protein